MSFFEIKDLVAGTEDKTIVNGFNLSINKGEVHAIMGPNGTGKSTLANIICGNPKYKITKGKIIFKDKDISTLSVDERAHLGLFHGRRKKEIAAILESVPERIKQVEEEYEKAKNSVG